MWEKHLNELEEILGRKIHPYDRMDLVIIELINIIKKERETIDDVLVK